MIDSTFRVLAAVLVCGMAAEAGTLQLGNPTVEDSRYVFPVVLNGPDAPVATMDFRLRFDPNVFRPVAAEPGPMALQSDKNVMANAPVPGEYVVVMMGVNTSSVDSGEVARIALERISGEGTGLSRVSLTNTTFSTLEGEEIPSEGSEQLIRLGDDAPVEDPDDPQDPEDPQENEDPAETPDEDDPVGGSPIGTPDGGTKAPAQGGRSGMVATADGSSAKADPEASVDRAALAGAFEDAASARARLERAQGAGMVPVEGVDGGDSGREPESDEPVQLAQGRADHAGGTAGSEIEKVESLEQEELAQSPGAAAILAEGATNFSGFWWVGMAGLGLIALALLMLRKRFFA